MPLLPVENLGGKTWGNIAMNDEMNAKARETPRARAKRVKAEKAKNNAEYERKRKVQEAAQRALNDEDKYGPNTGNVRRMRSSFKRMYKRNPTSFIKSRRRKLGRPSSTPRSSRSSKSRSSNHRTKRRSHAFGKRATKRASPPKVAVAKPRPGKFMKECKADCEKNGCARHKTKGDCKFIHRGEPEYNMLREDQKTKKGGFAISSPTPLSSVNTYTSWPGGVDPTARLYNQAAHL
jgi:hypothetical protein